MAKYARLFLLSILLGLFSITAQADGIPPSGETVCDVLNAPGVTNGLFGLCNAYCEAKDCDEYAPGDEPRSCQRLLANYDRKASGSDPAMPCLAQEPEPVVCPCWTPESQRLVDPAMGLPAGMCFNEFPGIGTVANYGNSDISFGHRDGECEFFNVLTNEFDLLPTDAEQNAVCLSDVLDLINSDFGGTNNCLP